MTYLTDADREALRFAFIHYHPDYDEGSRAYEVVEAIVRQHVSEALRSAANECAGHTGPSHYYQPPDGVSMTPGGVFSWLHERADSIEQGDKE